jgi:hypothetical protein
MLIASAKTGSANARGGLINTGPTVLNPRTTGAAAAYFRTLRRDTVDDGTPTQQCLIAPK